MVQQKPSVWSFLGAAWELEKAEGEKSESEREGKVLEGRRQCGGKESYCGLLGQESMRKHRQLKAAALPRTWERIPGQQ